MENGRGAPLLLATIVALAVLAIALAANPVCANGDGDAPEPEPVPEPEMTTIYGYVYNFSDEGNVPLEGVSVKLLDASSATIGTCTTDSGGRFEFTFETGQGTYLSFEMNGFTVRTLPGSWMSSVPEKQYYSFDLSLAPKDADGNYALSSEGDELHIIGMRATNTLIYGYVHGVRGDEVFPIENARVTLRSSTGQSIEAGTNAEGYFEADVPYGTYELRVSCNGFRSSEPITVTEEEPGPVDVSLTENEFGIGILGGVDAPHAMMIIGVMIIGAILLFSILAIHRSKRPESEIVIVNDVDDLDEEIEEEAKGLNRP